MKTILHILCWLLLTGSAEAAIRFASPTGGGTACTVESTPCTLTTAIGQLVGGDTLIVKNGTHTGVNFSNAIPSGTVGAPTIIIGETYRGAILQVASGASEMFSFSQARSNIQFLQLVFDGTGGHSDSVAAIEFAEGPTITDFEIVDNEMKNLRDRGVYISSTSRRIHFRRNYIHDVAPQQSGTPTPGNRSQPCMYFQASESIIEHNRLENCGPGINQRAGNTVTIRYNSIRSVPNFLDDPGSYALQILPDNVTDASKRVIAHNNTISDSLRGGIRVFSNAHFTRLYNNTVYGTANRGIRIDGNSGSEVINNTIRNIAGTNTSIEDSGVGTVKSNNICDDAQTGCTATDPLMINPANGDFRLTSSSPAIDAGATIAGLQCNGACDIGAYQTFQSGITASAAGQNVDITLPVNIAANLPIQPGTGITGFSLSDGRTITSASRLTGSSSVIRLTYSGTCTGGTFSYAPGNVTDNANIGNTGIGQPLFAITAQAITNNCGTPSPTTRYVSVSGSGTEAGTSCADTNDTTRCPISQVAAAASAGETWILKNGTYSGSGTVLNLTQSGTSTQPITLKAENPGLAFVQGDGGSPGGETLRITGDWWIIEGLRIENQDNTFGIGRSDGGVVSLSNTADDNILRKLIIRKPNRYGNNNLVTIQGKRNLIEENDGLQFHRNGFVSFGTAAQNNIFRLNYVGQTATNLGGTGQPNDGYVAYDSTNNKWESNIFESFLGASGGGEGFTAWGAKNEYFGNICLGAENNCLSLVSAASITTGASGYIVRDFAATGMNAYGGFARSPISMLVDGFTAHTSNIPDRGFIANNGDGAATTSLTLRNLMAIDTSGVFADPITSVTISHSQEWGTASAWGTGTSGRTDSPPASPGDVDPAFGDCRVNVPSTSPFSGVGFGGADIGANAIWVYRNGVRTAERMFDHTLTSTNRGKALHGPVVVAGVNDSSTGLVRSTVHQRIGFGTDGCAFPAGYGSGGVASPIIDYDFTDGAGVTVTDNSGNANHGTLAGGTTLPSWILGGGISFDPAVNDRVEVPYGSGIDPTTQSLTYCIGLRPQTGRAASIQHVLGWAEGTNQRLNIQQHNGSWKQSVQVGVAGGSSEFAVQEANTHICQRLDSLTNMAHLFVNGVKGNTADTAKSYTSFALASNLDIGRSQGAGSVWSGVDSFQFKLWPSALSDADIQNQFELWQQPPPPPTGHVVAQVAYQFYLLREFGGSLIKLPKQAVDAVSLPIKVPADAVFIVDVQLDCTAGPCPAFASVLEHDIDGAGVWTVVPDSGNPSINFYGTANTDPKIPSGVPSCPLIGTNACVSGGTQRTAAAVPVVEMAEDTSVVLRYIVRAPAVQKSLRLRLRNQDGTVFPVAQGAYATVTTVDNYAGVGL